MNEAAAAPSSPAATGPLVEARSSMETAAAGKGMSHKDCRDAIDKALKHPTVRFLREKMEKAGCPVWTRLLLTVNCKDNGVAGGYASRKGITVCCNHMNLQDEINQVLIHELIHAYDDCRVKNMDWTNCAYHACSEIRANHLSGDCHYKRELLRGFMKLRGHEQDCVRRRALKSIEKNPNCTGASGKDALESVWNICYNDTLPFDRAP